MKIWIKLIMIMINFLLLSYLVRLIDVWKFVYHVNTKISIYYYMILVILFYWSFYEYLETSWTKI